MSLFILKIARYLGVGLGIVKILFLFKQRMIEYIKFRNYLFEINDYEMLTIIGGIDEDGNKTIRNFPLIKAHRKLNDRYEITNDKYYYLFDEYMIKAGKKFAFAMVATFIFYTITVICEETFFR